MAKKPSKEKQSALSKLNLIISIVDHYETYDKKTTKDHLDDIEETLDKIYYTIANHNPDKGEAIVR